MDKKSVLQLYRKMMRASKNFEQYNFREYSKFRVRSGFKENKDVREEAKLKELIEFANSQYAIIQRQSSVSKLFNSSPLVIEDK